MDKYMKHLMNIKLQQALYDIFKDRHSLNPAEPYGSMELNFDLSTDNYDEIIKYISLFSRNDVKQYFIMSNKTKKYLESQFPNESGYNGDDAVIKFYGIDVAISNSIEYKKIILLNTFLC